MVLLILSIPCSITCFVGKNHVFQRYYYDCPFVSIIRKILKHNFPSLQPSVNIIEPEKTFFKTKSLSIFESLPSKSQPKFFCLLSFYSSKYLNTINTMPSMELVFTNLNSKRSINMPIL